MSLSDFELLQAVIGDATALLRPQSYERQRRAQAQALLARLQYLEQVELVHAEADSQLA